MTTILKVICKSHLHAGSGDSNYGVIDKLVQRDPTSTLPCIYSSSLKGAMREYWDEKLKKSADANIIFGYQDKGAVIFHQASIVSIPARSNLFPFFNVTSPMAIDSIFDLSKFLGIDMNLKELEQLKALKQEGKIIVFGNNIQNMTIEDYEGNSIVNNAAFTISDSLKSLLGEHIALVDDSHFKELCSDYNLPVIARNHLENGQSNNLWYEQIVPRESHFIFAVSVTPGKEKEAEILFNTMENEQLVQIGGNATIGYGQCLISKV